MPMKNAAATTSHNGALNPNAQRQKPRTLDEVLAARRVSGDLTVLQCTPVGEGAAAVVLMSADDYDSLVETIDILSRPEEVAAIRDGMADAAKDLRG